jgi:hypothetical protein
MTIRDEIDRTGPVVDRLNTAIRENPLAAGLIGAGIAWMLFGGTKGLGAAASVATNVAARAGSAASTAGGAVTDGLIKAGSKAASTVKDAASEIAGSVASIVPDMSLPDTDKMSEVGADARSTIGEGFTSAAAKSREYGTALQSRLSKSLERQPLLLGAIGLAIGAGIASTFASTAVEGALMGEQGAAAREKLQDLAGDVKNRAGKVMSDVKEEADRQGLTAERVKNVAADIGEKVKTVAGAGRDSVTQRFSN